MSAERSRVFVAGVGMTPFSKPGTMEGDFPDWVKKAGREALADAGVAYEAVERCFVGYVYGESTSGQRAVYELGVTGIPVVNVNNNCSTGSTALWLAAEAIRSGVCDCALAVGFERMQPGSLKSVWEDRTDPLDWHVGRMGELHEVSTAPFAPQLFGDAGRDHMRRFGSSAEHMAWIGWKNHKHSTGNPYAQFQQEFTLDEIKESRMIHDPLTMLQCSPTSDGAAAALLVSEKMVRAAGEQRTLVEIVGQELTTDTIAAFKGDMIDVVGGGMSRRAADAAYEQAGLAASDVDVCELHDCFSANELISYEALGFAKEGEGHLLVEREATTYGGSGPVVNPSGGLISKGHPLGATGLAQCAELTWQLRGSAGPRQVDGAEIGLQHNIGLGGAAVVTVYRGSGAL